MTKHILFIKVLFTIRGKKSAILNSNVTTRGMELNLRLTGLGFIGGGQVTSRHLTTLTNPSNVHRQQK